MIPKPSRPRPFPRFGYLAVFLCLLLVSGAGCTRVKKLMYEGFKRDEWQQPARVIEELELKEGDEVADIGAGSGYFSLWLSRAVGSEGTVYALDIDGEMLGQLEARAAGRNQKNIKTVRVQGEGPGLPPRPFDLIFLCNTYHHLENRVEYFADLRNHLKPEGRIAVVEFRPEGWLHKTFGHATSKTTIARELAEAGFRVDKDLNFLPRQNYQIFVAE